MYLLTELANLFGSDKGTSNGFSFTDVPPHGFTEVYAYFLEARRLEVKKVLELGIYHGASLRMWKEYFPNAQIYGFDIDARFMVSADRIKTYTCSQTDEKNIENIISEIGDGFDLIIDDGDHDTVVQQKTLGIFFKYLKSQGIYIIEDLHTSLGELAIAHGHLASHGLSISDRNTAYNMMTRFAKDRYLETKFIDAERIEYIANNTEYVEVFDMRKDQKSITSVIVKK
jgi:hypothetical protein